MPKDSIRARRIRIGVIYKAGDWPVAAWIKLRLCELRALNIINSTQRAARYPIDRATIYQHGAADCENRRRWLRTWTNTGAGASFVASTPTGRIPLIKFRTDVLLFTVKWFGGKRVGGRVGCRCFIALLRWYPFTRSLALHGTGKK